MTGVLDGRRILVTGAATGVGAAAVTALVAAGARVAATYHTSPPPDGVDATWLRCDLRGQSGADAAVAGAVDALGGVDVLIHAAGQWQPGIPGRLTVGDIDAIMDTNVKSTILVNQAAFAAMSGSGGQILNFGSAEAVLGSPISAGYAAAKGAVAAWTRSIARAWAGYGITANALAPAVDTPGAHRLRDFLGPDAAAFLDQQMHASIPLGGKLGDPAHDLAPVLVFLSGPGARFITGQLLAVDGGLVMVGS